MAIECPSVIGGGFNVASDLVPQQFDFFTDLVVEYLNAANQFSQVLENYGITPVEIQSITWDINAGFTPFEQPADPGSFVTPLPQFGDAKPTAPTISDIDTSGINVSPPLLTEPALPPINIPSAPIVSLPSEPGNVPVISDVTIPTYEGGPLPDVPTLFDLNLPDVITINIDDLDVERPNFVPPDALQDTYRYDFTDFRTLIWTEVEANVDATGVTDVHARLQAMLAGGTGLPAAIEQALFDRAIGRDEISSVQAVQQAEQEWAARGFDLPGSTLLARTQEIRTENRRERGRINRELSIQYHTQEIENLRFSVQQAIALEGTLLDAHTRIQDVARQLADGHWVVIKGIYDSEVALFALYLEIYRTDVEVYKTRLEAELTKVELYKAQLEAQRLIGQLNLQLVEIYKAEIDGILASVEIFKAQVDAVNVQLRAQLAKLEVFKAEIDVYTARLQGERIKFDIYNSQVSAEEAKARVYTAQVQAFGSRIDAYRTQVGAEVAKVEAQTAVVRAETDIYAQEVTAWRAGIEADSINLQSAVQVYRAQLEKYEALLSAEQYRVQGEARNFELEIESERARVQSALKQADQAIEQLKHITSMGLSATEIAAKVNAQLAASAMSAINVYAGMSSSNAVSASDSRTCSTNFSASVNV